MNGVHDMGGMMGFGPVVPEPNEPVFHAAWEGRAMAMNVAMGPVGGWGADRGRFSRECIPPASRTLVFGTTREKDLKGQLRVLLPGADRVVATQYVENPRAVPPGEIVEAVAELNGPQAVLTYHPAEALAVARAITPEDGLICVTGSLFLAAEVRSVILGSTLAVSAL